MPRTIVITFASPEGSIYGSRETWRVSEDSRTTGDLQWEEMLGLVARITMEDATNAPPMQTLDEHMERSVKRERSRPDPLHKCLREVIATYDKSGFTGPTESIERALKAARDEIAKADDAALPF